MNSSTLYLTIGRESYRIIDFFSDGLIVDFPGGSTCRQYNDLNSFGFAGNEYFGISVENVVGLYDCEDSSLCKADCETDDLPGCDGNDGGSLACCYPLSDQSVWRLGDGFSAFSKFGCRGFSSWVVSRGTNAGKRGVKLEWAVPRNMSNNICDTNTHIVNATAIEAGVRCSCQDGFVGDGFANGVGCLRCEFPNFLNHRPSFSLIFSSFSRLYYCIELISLAILPAILQSSSAIVVYIYIFSDKKCYIDLYVQHNFDSLLQGRPGSTRRGML